MTPRNPENISSWLVAWSLVTMPPRDPNDDDDEDEEEDDDEDEPPVVREPDEE